MSTEADKNSVRTNAVESWYQTAARISVLAGIFCLVVVLFLIGNYVRRTGTDERRVEELDGLKVEVRSKPDDEQIIKRIRALDLQVRKDRIRRLDFSRLGSYLLLGGTAVLLASVLVVASLRKKLPFPQKQSDVRDKQIREAILSRRMVTFVSAAFVLAAMALWLGGIPDFLREGKKKVGGPTVLSETWPRFRGADGSGVYVSSKAVPTRWDSATSEGILWKIAVPLGGHGSPVVWGERVFLSGADANTREVYCFDARSGKILWKSAMPEIADRGGGKLEVSEDTGYAASTVVTDGSNVCAIFANGDVGCFNFEGKNLWAVNLGIPESAYGYATSPAIYRSLLIIQYDQGTEDEQKSSIKALKVLSGEPVWETKRPVASSWTTPIIVNAAGRDQIITCSDPWVISYDPNDGQEIWRAECVSGEIAPSPIYAGGLVFVIEPYVKVAAIRPDGKGDVTKTHIAWSVDIAAPDICSPVSNGEVLVLLTTDGGLSCRKAADGTVLWEHSLPGSFYSSPSFVNGNLFILGEKGLMHIAEAAGGYKELAKCMLGERCHASPAFADGRIYLRGVKNLYCIGSTAAQH